MLQFLKKVGAGKKRFKDLTQEEAYTAEKSIIDGRATDLQTGAFWSAERIKYASINELKGFIDAHREYMDFIDLPVKPLDLAVNYDGKDRSVHILPASIFIATSCGVYLSGHGAEKVPSKYGITYHQVLEKMGAKTPAKKETVVKALTETGFGFAHQSLFAQKLFNLMEKRREFGLRTYHNTMERMLNPFRTDRVITGVSHLPYIQKYTELARYVGMEKITVFKSLEGGIEPFPNHETKVFFNGRETVVYPEGIDKNAVLRRITAEENGRLCLDLLQGKDRQLEEFALLTAGILMVAYGLYDSLPEAVEMGREALHSGKAYEKFKKYAEITEREVL